MKKRSQVSNWMERFSLIVARASGSGAAFTVACAIIVVWAATGPIFHYSDTWQLVINTSTTIVTFLMVFLIQRSQNKETQAIELKLNEIVAAISGASNRLIDVESLSEAELLTLHRHFIRLAAMARRDGSLLQSHSVEEAERRHRKKESSDD
jgi:low affinity Fe/Cu permease